MRAVRVFVLLSVLQVARSFPANGPIRAPPIVPTNEQFDFMRRFGYLEDKQFGFEAQYSQEVIINAIIDVQRFGGIPQTGIFDEATLKLMKRKRCGVKDIFRNRSKRYSLIGRGWKKLNMTYFVANWNSKLGETQVKSQLKRSLDMWAKHGHLLFTEGYDNSTDIKFSFHIEEHGDSYPFDGLGGVLGHAFFPFTNNGGSVHFDDEENWDLKSDYDLETTGFFLVAVHELGHALGLGHSDVPEAIMYPYHSDYDPQDLDNDDIQALNKLYSPYMKNNINENDNSENILKSSAPTISNRQSGTEISTEPTMFTTIEKAHASLDQRLEGICNGFDTIAVLKMDLFVFKGQDIWKFSKKGHLNDGYPIKIWEAFQGFPSTIKKVDAVYERRDGSIIFFSGIHYWHYNIRVDGPNLISDYQIPENTTIKAVLLWPKNERTYLFQGDIFWRFDDNNKKLDKHYPKRMNRWRGIPSDIDASINWRDGSTYFFKELLFWRFNNKLIRVDDHYPLPTPQVWFGCPEIEETFKQF